MKWNFKTFYELSTYELFLILQVRGEVFVVEQNCPYLDPDEWDLKSIHVFAVEDKEIVVYLRIIPAGLKYKEVSIGRVLTTSRFRNKSLGHDIMKKSISYIHNEMKEEYIRISAQSYLKKFYENHGFLKVSEEYLEDEIPHMEMLRGGISM